MSRLFQFNMISYDYEVEKPKIVMAHVNDNNDDDNTPNATKAKLKKILKNVNLNYLLVFINFMLLLVLVIMVAIVNSKMSNVSSLLKQASQGQAPLVSSGGEGGVGQKLFREFNPYAYYNN